MIPGKGGSGIPYIHIKDVNRIFLRCLALPTNLSHYAIFLASQKGAVSHRELYPVLKAALKDRRSNNPMYIPKSMAKIALRLKSNFRFLFGGLNFEQPWMLEYTDRPWLVNNDFTKKELDWCTDPDLDILKRLPVIMKLYMEQKNHWISRNNRRISGNYIYTPNQNGL